MKALVLAVLLAVPVIAQEAKPPPQTAERPRRVEREPLDQKGLIKAYREFLTELLPEHRGISVYISPQMFVPDILLAEHPLFSRYSFRVGALGDHVWNWLVEHKDELKAADIGWVAVGSEFRDKSELAVKDAFPKKEKKK